ncbi:Endoribonuclease L-PSP/chorismate mutase-like protein [Aspergillus oleicola]
MLARAARARTSLVADNLRSAAGPISSLKSYTMTQSPMETRRNVSSKVSNIHTYKAYKPFAHYSQAIKSAPGTSIIWLSGQIPADANCKLITGSIADKTAVIIKNTEAILKEAGSGLEGVVKVVVYVKDASIMPEFAKVYDPAFPHRPARSMVEASALPAGVDIQVDFVAVC